MNRKIVFVVFSGFQILDVAGPLAAFEIANGCSAGAYDLRLVSLHSGLVRSSSGLSIHTDRLSKANRADTLIVSGGDGVRAALNERRLLEFLRLQSKSARRVASVCVGSYLLAAAGLLNGRRTTTHWSTTHDFSLRYPNVNLEADRIFVRDGRFWSSAGITAGIDLALALISEDLGEETAKSTARQLVVERRRSGGQSQFSALLEMERPDGRFSSLLDHVRKHPAQRLNVGALAELAAMSERHFTRSFTAETGISPAKAIERLRVEAARAALNGGGHHAQDVARKYGFRDGEHMRRAFMRVLGTPPSLHKHR